MIPTPRTDDAEVYYSEIVNGSEGGLYWVKADFAQQLEQELHWARVRIAEMRDEVIEEVAHHIDGAPLTYAGPDPQGVSDLKRLIIWAILDLKGPK
jgi:hypothetical protein